MQTIAFLIKDTNDVPYTEGIYGHFCFEYIMIELLTLIF